MLALLLAQLAQQANQLAQQPIVLAYQPPILTPELSSNIPYPAESYALLEKMLTKVFFETADHPITAIKQGVTQFITNARTADDGGAHHYSLAKLVAKKAEQHLELSPTDKQYIYAQLTQGANIAGYTKEAIIYGKRYTRLAAKQFKRNDDYTSSSYQTSYHFSHALYIEGRIAHSHSVLLTMIAAVENNPALLNDYENKHLQKLFLTVNNKLAFKNALKHYDQQEYQTVLKILDAPLANLEEWNVKHRGLIIASRIHLGHTQDERFSALVEVYLNDAKQKGEIFEIAHRQLIRLETQNNQYKKAYSLLNVLLGKFGIETLQGFPMFQDLVMFSDVYFENGHYKNASYCAKTACDVYDDLDHLSSNDRKAAKQLLGKASDILFESTKALPPEWKDYWFILKAGLGGAASDFLQDVKGNAVPLMGLVAALASYSPLRRLYGNWRISKGRTQKKLSPKSKQKQNKKKIQKVSVSTVTHQDKTKAKTKAKAKAKAMPVPNIPKLTPKHKSNTPKRLPRVVISSRPNQPKGKENIESNGIVNGDGPAPKSPSKKKLKRKNAPFLEPVFNIKNKIKELRLAKKSKPSSYYHFAMAYLLNAFFTAIHSLPKDCEISSPFDTPQEISGFATLLLVDTGVLDALVEKVAFPKKCTLGQVVNDEAIVKNAALLKECPKNIYEECLINVFEKIGRSVLFNALPQSYSEASQVFCFAAKMLLALLYKNVSNKDWKAIVKNYPNADRLIYGSSFQGVDRFVESKLRSFVQSDSPLRTKKTQLFLCDNVGYLEATSMLFCNSRVYEEAWIDLEVRKQQQSKSRKKLFAELIAAVKRRNAAIKTPHASASEETQSHRVRC
jgi:hypothetical protein